MKTMPSSEFRKTYASLTDPIAVTVNGHRIGAWIPGDHLDRMDEDNAARRQRLDERDAAPLPPNVQPFNSRGSRPVPKGK